ncbi:MAG: ATP-binding protein [Candidatus Aureabacteria bacterium]|nr:ATP-binding protein [Candidatus Auribacterota bacterium]
MVMNFDAYLLISVAIAYIGLALFIYRKSPSSPVNIAFCVYAVTVSCWTLSVYMVVMAYSERSALFWIRASFISAMFMANAFYIFSCVFPEGRPVKFRHFAFIIASPCLIAILMHPLLLTGVQLGKYAPRARYGPLLPLYIAYFLLVTGTAFLKLASKWRRSSGIKRLQIQYVFLGNLFLLLLASISNFIAPLVGIQQTESYGPVFTLVMTGFVVYAIAKYHLMDITIVIKRATLYATLTASITVGYIGIVLLTNWIFGGMIGLQSLILAMIPALLIAFAFTPLKEAIQAFIDSTLFKKRYEHRKILSDLSKILTSIFSLEELLSLILRVITKSMGIENGVIYLPDGTGKIYIPQAAQGSNDTPAHHEMIGVDNPLIRKLMWRRELIIREQLERLPQAPENRAITALLEKVHADICIPVYSKDTLTGLLFFGHKETGETFTSEDIEMFTTLSHHIAVAIENAQLYTKVEESKRYQEILMNNLTSGVVAVDLNSRITAFNSRAESILRMPVTETVGRSIVILPAELRIILKDTLEQRESFSAEEVVLKIDGNKELPLAVSSSIFNSADGKTLGALIVFSDLTDRKVLEAEMRRADRLASLGTLAAGMAHEIKNPLVSLKTFTQLLPQKYFDREFREDFAKLASQEVDRINYLVEQLLDFARPSSPMFKSTDLSEILNNTLFLLATKIHEQNIDIRKEIGKTPLMVMADGDQLKQVFLNIIINALQAMEHFGTIIVKVAKILPEEPLAGAIRGGGIAKRLYTLRTSGSAVIEVSDTGKGIDPKDLPHLFDPFFTTKEAGVGLGLAIAHSIIEEHGGIIDVKSRVGEGTTFSITLPLAEDAA